MIDINLPNVVTIGLVSIAVLALTKWGLSAAGVTVPSWL